MTVAVVDDVEVVDGVEDDDADNTRNYLSVEHQMECLLLWRWLHCRLGRLTVIVTLTIDVSSSPWTVVWQLLMHFAIDLGYPVVSWLSLDLETDVVCGVAIDVQHLPRDVLTYVDVLS